MHRLTRARLLVVPLVGAVACGGSPKPKPSLEPSGAESIAAGAEAPTGSDTPPDKRASACSGQDIANLEDLLLRSECEVPDANPGSLDNPDLKGKLEVTVAASPTKVAPGGKAELVVTFANRSNEPLPLSFRIDPVPRFETEAYDAKKRRVDMPAGQPPPPPKGHSAPPPAEAKVARVTIAPGGAARVRVPWDAVKTKWAPDKVRGTAAEKGYPRSPAGPLPKGKYTIRVLTPLVGVFEGADHEVSGPKLEIEVG